jgi:hypothetical protein
MMSSEDIVLKKMRELNVPVTLENYIGACLHGQSARAFGRRGRGRTPELFAKLEGAPCRIIP